MAPAILFTRFGSTVVLAQGERDVPASQWSDLVDIMATPGVDALLVLTSGGSVDAQQRMDLRKMLRDGQRLVVVSDDVRVRVVVKAVRVLGIDVKHFGCAERGLAISDVGLPDDERTLEKIESMMAAVRG